MQQSIFNRPIRPLEYDDGDGMPYEEFVEEVTRREHDEDKVEHRIEELKDSGQVYFPRVDGEDWIAKP